MWDSYYDPPPYDDPAYLCGDCGQAFDPRDDGEIDAHRDEHWYDFLRAQCPIPDDVGMLRRLVEHRGYDHGLKIAGVREWPPREADDDDEEVPF